MTYEIGKYYRLIKGDKGMYVGKDIDGHCFTVLQQDGARILLRKLPEDLPEWTEPRGIEVTVYLYDEDGELFASFNKLEYTKFIAKRAITIKEGEGME